MERVQTGAIVLLASVHQPQFTQMKFDETQIERYVRRPDAFGESTRKEIETFLEENAHAREVAAFYRSYYEALDEEQDVGLEEDRTGNTSSSPF